MLFMPQLIDELNSKVPFNKAGARGAFACLPPERRLPPERPRAHCSLRGVLFGTFKIAFSVLRLVLECL